MIEVLKQALDALEAHADIGIKADKAITSLRQAIEQAEKAEPVAWMNKHGACMSAVFKRIDANADEYNIPLYTRPQHVPTSDTSQERVAETQEQRHEQEPVVWMYQDKISHAVKFQKHMSDFVDHSRWYETPLYTSPPQRQPLTYEQIYEIWEKAMVKNNGNNARLDNQPFVHFARAIEQAHGIKEKNT